MLLLLVPLAGCSASASIGKTVDDGKIEDEIAAVLEKETGVTVKTVACPDDIAGKAGTTFKCDVTAADGTKVVSRGEIKKKKRFEASTPVLNTGKIQAAVGDGIKQQTGTTVEVDCPDLVQLEQGAESTCKATAGEDVRDVAITQKDDTGNISYELQ